MACTIPTKRSKYRTLPALVSTITSLACFVVLSKYLHIKLFFCILLCTAAWVLSIAARQGDHWSSVSTVNQLSRPTPHSGSSRSRDTAHSKVHISPFLFILLFTPAMMHPHIFCISSCCRSYLSPFPAKDTATV